MRRAIGYGDKTSNEKPKRGKAYPRPKTVGGERDLCLLSVAELERGYRARTFSPLEVMQAVFRRLDEVNPKINAVITQTRETALAEARAATRKLRAGTRLPPLHGVPVS